MTDRNLSKPPSVVKGRRGLISILDCMVASLWEVKAPKGTILPAKTFRQLTDEATAMRGRPVATASVRAAIYRHSDLFEQVIEGDVVLWRLKR